MPETTAGPARIAALPGRSPMPEIRAAGLHPIIAQLRRARQKRCSAQQLADQIGKSRGVVTDWEYGRHSPNLDNLTAWAAALGYEVILRPARGRRGEWWRTGRKIPRNLYRITDEHPDGQDIGRMDTPELAALVVAAVNRMIGDQP